MEDLQSKLGKYCNVLANKTPLFFEILISRELTNKKLF